MVAAAVVTFSAIAPILLQHCVPCHHAGGPGPFPLTAFADAHKHAHQIAAVTASRYMPPALPASTSGPFLDEHRLAPGQIQSIADWVRAGAQPGPVTSVSDAPAPADDGNLLGTPDLVLTAAQPLLLPAGATDLFWNFVFHPNLPAGRYVRAVVIEPGSGGSARLVHHANLLVDRSGAIAKRESTPGTGFPGMDVAIRRSPLDPVSHFLFWKPGSLPYAEPPGFSWLLNPGNLLVLNTHLQGSGKPEQVQPTIKLYFTSQPPTRLPLIWELEADNQLNIPPGARAFTVHDTITLPEDCRLLAIYPHAHYLGTVLRATASLPGGRSVELIRIPHWDLRWQAVYRYREPPLLPKGTRIAMTYQYDNSRANPRNPNHPPQRVQAGNRAADEMAHLSLQLLPEGTGDRRRPLQEAMARHLLAKDSRNAEAHLSLGAILLARLRMQEAIPELRAAIAGAPLRPEAHDMLGASLQNVGQLQPAIAEYRAALTIEPDYVSARYNLALALARAGQYDEAVRHMEQVRRQFPNEPRIQADYEQLQSRAHFASSQP